MYRASRRGSIVPAHRVGRTLRRRRSRRLLLLLLLAGLALLAGMDPDAGADEREDAIRAEEVAPVVELLAAIRERFAEGRVLKLDLERERRPAGRFWVYEAKILMPDGDVFEVEYDARSLEVLELNRPGDED